MWRRRTSGGGGTGGLGDESRFRLARICYKSDLFRPGPTVVANVFPYNYHCARKIC